MVESDLEDECGKEAKDKTTFISYEISYHYISPKTRIKLYMEAEMYRYYKNKRNQLVH